MVRTPLASIRSSRAENPGRVSMGSAPDTAASVNSPIKENAARLAKPSMAARHDLLAASSTASGPLETARKERL
jgi:hypothetical protein